MERVAPEISVIIPAYNEAAIIGKTVSSIQGATHSDLVEIIVVCNGCTDHTLEIAKEAGAIAINAPEKGAAKASNYGAKIAKGRTLVFLDADTSIAENLIDEVRKAVGTGSIGGRTVIKWEGENMWAKLFSLVSYVHRYKWGGFCFVDRSIFEDIGGYAEGKYGFDFDLAQRVSSMGKTAFLWRSHVMTSSRRFDEEGWLKHLLLAAKRYYIDSIIRKRGVKSEDEIQYDDHR